MIVYKDGEEIARSLDEIPVGGYFRELSHPECGIYRRIEDAENTNPYAYGEPLGRAICVSSGKVYKFYPWGLIAKVGRGVSKN